MQCVGDCEEAQQRREVICMVKKNGWNVVTYDLDCSSDKRPRHKQKCRPTECDRTDSKWFATDWSEVGNKLPFPVKLFLQVAIVHT